MNLSKHFNYHPAVLQAQVSGAPVLAMESTIVAHGLPYPKNIQFLNAAEEICRKLGVVPATIAVYKGRIQIGLSDDLKKIISSDDSVKKIGARDIGIALSQGWIAATTVSATMRIAGLSSFKVFATGGIGGVHINAHDSFDVSQDLTELSQAPVLVVSAGAKAVLDIPKTLEFLETLSVPVIGYQTSVFPAFYYRDSSCLLSSRCNSPDEIANLYKIHSELGIQSGVLVVNPIPEKDEISQNIIQPLIEKAIEECNFQKITGKDVTPYLLKRIEELSSGDSIKANLALALNNVRLGCEIALALH
jgi:pseudouridine-5'-phosphate glycosidase